LQWRPLNFNGVIDRNTDKEKYVCRHLSIEKIRQWGRAMFVEAGPDPMASAAGIEREITPDTEALFEALVHGPRSAHLVAHAHWPDFVRHQFEQMQREGRRVAIALMTTGSHAMALRFDATNPDQPRVECWDPNFTDITTTSDPPFDFRSMFHDFARVRDIYFGSDHSLHGPASFVKVTMIDHPLDPGLDVADRPRDSATSIAFAGLPETCHPTLVHDLIAFGHNPPDLAPLAAAIDNQPLTREQCLGLLRALDPLARPSLHIAASRGHDRAIAAMVPLLLAACHKGLLNETDVRTVMEARVLKGTALGSAFTEGHAHVVTALGRAAQQLWREGALSPRTVFHLMRAANPSGASTIERIKDTRTAKALDASLKKLYRAGALTKEDYQELHKDAKETLEDLRAQAKARQRSARTEPVAPTLLRV
jgi:hypothetical protein